MRIFSQQAADDAFQRAVDNFHHLAFVDERAGIELELAPDQVDIGTGARRGGAEYNERPS